MGHHQLDTLDEQILKLIADNARIPFLPVYAVPDSVKKQAEPQPDTVKVEKKKNPQPAQAEDAGNLYEYIRQKAAEDSIRRKEFFRKDKVRNNQYDVQREIQRLREQQN